MACLGLESGGQDGRRRRIHWAMAAPAKVFGSFSPYPPIKSSNPGLALSRFAIWFLYQICRPRSPAMAKTWRQRSSHASASGGAAPQDPSRGGPARQPVGVHLRLDAVQAMDAREEHAVVRTARYRLQKMSSGGHTVFYTNRRQEALLSVWSDLAKFCHFGKM